MFLNFRVNSKVGSEQAAQHFSDSKDYIGQNVTCDHLPLLVNTTLDPFTASAAKRVKLCVQEG